MFLLQIYKLNVLLAKNIISKGRGFLEQNVNLTETPAVSKPQKFKICGTADFAKKKKTFLQFILYFRKTSENVSNSYD